MMKRLCAYLLCIVMVLTLLPMDAYAQTGESEQITVGTEMLTEDDAQDEILTAEIPESQTVEIQETPSVEVEESLPVEVPQEQPVESEPVVTEPVETEPSAVPTLPEQTEGPEILVKENIVLADGGAGARTASGTCGDNVTWSLDANGVLTISGTGRMRDYSSSNSAPWFSERLEIKEVNVSDGVTYLGDYAFYYCTNLQEVTLTSTLGGIGYCAFNMCTSLEQIEIPEGVTYINSYAFSGCEALSDVELPSTLTSISSNAFDDCKSLAEIELKENVEYLGYGAFYGCTALKSIVLPEKITTIDSYVFEGCTSLESVDCLGNVTKINSEAFRDCVNLKEFDIPEGVTFIGNYAFYNCASLPAVDLPSGLSYISSSSFSGCSSLTKVEIPKGVARIESSAFCNCTGLTEVTLPTGLVSIQSSAFSGCTSLPEIEIKDGVTSIGEACFSGCTSLESIILPSTVTAIANSTFSNCSSLVDVTWPTKLNSIGQDAFEFCTSLKKVDLPDSVKTIGNYAFDGCSSLKELGLKEGLNKISSYAFRNCTALESVKIPSSVTEIGAGAFYNCSALQSILMEEGITGIGQEAFRNCTALESVKIPSSVTEIGISAFRDCKALESLEFQGCEAYISNYAFAYCSSLKSVQMEEGITGIGQEAFRECTSLESVKIPSSVTEIGSNAFYYCKAMKSLEFEEGVTSIDSCAFENCDSLLEVKLPEGLTAISYQLFYSCDNLAKVSIPSTVVNIKQEAFVYCPKLTEITFCHHSDAELSIYADAFRANNSSTKVPTTVYVPYAKDVNPVIKNHSWESYGRTVTFESWGYLPAESVTIDVHPTEIETGLEVQFSATMDPWYSTSELEWSVEPITGNAVIDENGVLIGTEPGFVDVICKSSDGDISAPPERILIKPPTAYVSSISIRCEGDAEAEVELGGQVQMIADVRPGNAKIKDVTWEVENGTGKAEITEDGVLKGLATGSVTVYAMAQDGSEVIGSRMVEVMRYVTDVKLLFNGREELAQLGVGEKARMSCIFTPEDANYPTATITVENGTGEATYRDGYLTGVKEGTVTVKVVTKDGYLPPIVKEIEIVGAKEAYPVAGGNLYYNTVTGTIVGSDEGVTSANIPAIINGTKITAIGPMAFYDQDSLTSVTIPSSVTLIGYRAFYNCENISSVRFNSTGVKIIDEYAFAYCYKLINLTIPEGVEYIGSHAFYDCDSLQNLTIPEGIPSIGYAAFSGLNNLKNLTIPGDYDTTDWFSNNSLLDTVTFTGTKVRGPIMYESSNGGYHWSAMSGRYAKKVIITDTVTEIEDHAFRSMDCIEEVVIGNGVERIGAYAFADSDYIVSVEMGDRVKTIGNDAFYDCDSLAEIVIGSGVTAIGDSAFENCTNLTKVVLPEGIKTLGERTFRWCQNLNEINLPSSLKSVGRECFTETGDNLHLIDLSMNPDKMPGQELQLEYKMPAALIAATGQKNELYWQFRYEEEDMLAGNVYPWDIAHLDGKSGTIYSHGNGVGRVTVVCRDEYTGAKGVCMIEIASGITIRTDREENYLVSGEVMQLSAYIMPGNIKAKVDWYLREQDYEFASIDPKGKLSARAVSGAKQIEVTAMPYDGGEPATITLWIVPRTTGLSIYEGSGDVTDQELDIDSSVFPVMEFRAVAYPEGAATDVYWRSSNEKIAVVDNGMVTFNGIGIVTITAFTTDGSEKSASVRLNVTFKDSAKKLTATLDIEGTTLKTKEQAQMLVYGDDESVPMDPALFEYGVPSSQSAIATVDADGVITAGEKTGTSTITATLAGDPLKRKVSIKVTVEARPTEKLLLHPTAEAPAEVQMLDENGNVTQNAADLAGYSVLLKKADVEQRDYSFVITPEAFNSLEAYQPGKTDLKWASSNTKVATVSVQKDGTAIITVKKGMDGACVISAVTTDKAKVESLVTVNVMDFSPRLESTTLTLNTYLTNAAELTLIPSYENWITNVALYENGMVSSRLNAAYDDGILIFSANETIPNSNLAPVLKVTCVDGVTYDYKLSAKVKNAAPSVTVKQVDKFNLAYTDSTASVKVTVANTAITNVELDGTNDFTVVEYDVDTAQALIRFSDSYIFDHAAKPDLKADLLVYLEGYEQPVKKSITIGTTTKNPEVVLKEKTSIINTAISQEHTTSFGFQMKNATELLDLSDAIVDVTASFADWKVQDDRVILTLTGTKGGTATVTVQLDNWMNPVKLSHKVTVDTKKPTLKFGASAVKLNSIFTDMEGVTSAILTHSNLEISSMELVSTAKAGTDARVQAEKIEVRYNAETSEVVARIADPENVPKNGSYTFDAKVTLADGTVLNVAKLKITVESAAPKVKLSTTTLKLNKFLGGDEVAFANATLDKPAGYSIVGFQLPDNWEESNIPVEFDYVNGQLTAKLLDANAAVKTHTIKLYPILLQEATGQEVVLPTASAVKVQVYNNAKITVSLSAKGKLDAVNPDSEIRYTLSKITNAIGSVTGVYLSGQDAELFEAVLNEDGTVSLKLLSGVDYSTKQTYKIQFNFCICGVDVTSSVISFKVTQSALKFKTTPVTPTLYQSQTTPLIVRVALTEPSAAAMESITINEKTAEAFLDALSNEQMDVTISEDGRSAVVAFDIRNAANLQFGKSYTVLLDVDAVGSAVDGKSNQLKVTIKVAK